MRMLSIVGLTLLSVVSRVQGATLTLLQGAPNCTTVNANTPTQIIGNLTLTTVLNPVTNMNDIFYCYDLPDSNHTSFKVTNDSGLLSVTRRDNQACQDPVWKGNYYSQEIAISAGFSGSQCIDAPTAVGGAQCNNYDMNATAPTPCDDKPYTVLVNLDANATAPAPTSKPTSAPTPAWTSYKPGDCQASCGVTCTGIQVCFIDTAKRTCTCTAESGAVTGIIIAVLFGMSLFMFVCCFFARCGVFSYRAATAAKGAQKV